MRVARSLLCFLLQLGKGDETPFVAGGGQAVCVRRGSVG